MIEPLFLAYTYRKEANIALLVWWDVIARAIAVGKMKVPRIGFQPG